MKVTITQSFDLWILVIQSDSTYRIFPHQRLVEALETASTLKVHVDNIDELPVSQYCLQSDLKISPKQDCLQSDGRVMV